MKCLISLLSHTRTRTLDDSLDVYIRLTRTQTMLPLFMDENVIISNCFDCYGLLSLNLLSCLFVAVIPLWRCCCCIPFVLRTLVGRFDRGYVSAVPFIWDCRVSHAIFHSWQRLKQSLCVVADAMLTIMSLARHVHSLNLKIFVYDVYKRISKGFIYSIKPSFFGCVFLSVAVERRRHLPFRLSLNRILKRKRFHATNFMTLTGTYKHPYAFQPVQPSFRRTLKSSILL